MWCCAGTDALEQPHAERVSLGQHAWCLRHAHLLTGCANSRGAEVRAFDGARPRKPCDPRGACSSCVHEHSCQKCSQYAIPLSCSSRTSPVGAWAHVVHIPHCGACAWSVLAWCVTAAATAAAWFLPSQSNSMYLYLPSVAGLRHNRVQ
jgi:hypothetical protein